MTFEEIRNKAEVKMKDNIWLSHASWLAIGFVLGAWFV